MSLKVYNIDAKEVDQLEPSFLEREMDAKLVHNHYQLHRYQLAALRAGTASTKTKGEVSGGGSKPYKQKGTGHARRGSNRTPLRPGGGIVFGPKPRSYSFKLNSKVITLTLKSALSAKRDIINVLRLTNDEMVKTASMVAFFAKQGVGNDKKILAIIDKKHDDVLFMAIRNIANVQVVDVNYMYIEPVLSADYIVVSDAAFISLKEKSLV
jgi:large subunit ribosomal protein L4